MERINQNGTIFDVLLRKAVTLRDNVTCKVGYPADANENAAFVRQVVHGVCLNIQRTMKARSRP